MDNNIRTIDEYLADFSGEARDKLDIIRKTIQEVVPEETVERIAYGIPTFTYHGNLVHFAGYEGHIGFYPGSAPIRDFAEELKPYKTAKGTIRFPLDKPLPLELIRKITLYCIERNKAKKK